MRKQERLEIYFKGIIVYFKFLREIISQFKLN